MVASSRGNRRSPQAGLGNVLRTVLVRFINTIDTADLYRLTNAVLDAQTNRLALTPETQEILGAIRLGRAIAEQQMRGDSHVGNHLIAERAEINRANEIVARAIQEEEDIIAEMDDEVVIVDVQRACPEVIVIADENPVETCIICMSEPADAKLVPCDHMTCMDCAIEIQNRLRSQCPICREVFTDIIEG